MEEYCRAAKVLLAKDVKTMCARLAAAMRDPKREDVTDPFVAV